MRRILDVIDEEQARFAAHPFLARMEAQAPYDEIRGVVPALAFWVLTFHDLLELCEDRMDDPGLRRIIGHHRAEETGHHRWYLDDLVRLEVPLPSSPALFGPEHEPVRRASYSLMAEAIRSSDDWVRISLVLMMEATGAVFFRRAAAYRHWPARGLEFFSGQHLAVEQAHVLLERRMRELLRQQLLSPERHGTTTAAVRRGFAAFHRMFDGANVRPAA